MKALDAVAGADGVLDAALPGRRTSAPCDWPKTAYPESAPNVRRYDCRPGRRSVRRTLMQVKTIGPFVLAIRTVPDTRARWNYDLAP